MDESRILVFDIGGTCSRAGVYDTGSDRVVRSARLETPSFHRFPRASADELRSMLYESVRVLAERLGDPDPRLVSLGFPGPVDAQGIALRAPTLWGRDDRPEPVAARLRQLWPTAGILVSNDLSAAGHCFLRHDEEDMCVVTVSSGIGHKVFLNGRPVVGAAGRGGEIGHLRVDFSENAPVCDCGDKGHLGAVASGRALRHQALRLARLHPADYAGSSLGHALRGDQSELDNTLISEAFRAGDPWASRVVDRVAEPLGPVLAGIHCAVGVERFVVMGGLAHALGKRYLEMVATAAARSEWALGQDWHRMLELGEMGDDAGLVGAGRLMSRVARFDRVVQPADPLELTP